MLRGPQKKTLVHKTVTIHVEIDIVDEGNGASVRTLCCAVCGPMNTFIATNQPSHTKRSVVIYARALTLYSINFGEGVGEK